MTTRTRWLWTVAILALAPTVAFFDGVDWALRPDAPPERARNFEIEFSGRVHDFEGQGVPAATVTVRLLVAPSENSGSYTEETALTTSSTGEFVFKGHGGAIQIVSVAKEGFQFHPSKGDPLEFLFGRPPETPPRTDGYTYYLRKPLPPTFLLNNSATLRFAAADSGNARTLDLILGPQRTLSFGATGTDLRVLATREEESQSWTVTLSSDREDGVLLRSESKYQAPATGYEAECVLTIAPGKASEWPLFLYLRSRDPAVYSRVLLYGKAGEDRLGIRLDSVTNPFGERNFEAGDAMPFERHQQLENEIFSSFRRGERPVPPDSRD